MRMMKDWRTRRALLATTALTASLVAVVASPSWAVTDRADYTTPLSACVGPALVDRGFSDVSPEHAFNDAINCIAYYGVTRGTGDGSTYSPDRPVTRAQMAVFMARAAEVAGAVLDDPEGVRFTDLGDTWPEAADSINRLAAARIIPSGQQFRPAEDITRAEMAAFLVGLLIETAPAVSRDSLGTILLGESGSVGMADDYFGDARNAETSALYELGVTRGSRPAEVQDDTNPPLDYDYEPERSVTRGQMAAFITRALAHTSARPVGITAQSYGSTVVVSVRDDKFRPAPPAAVDVFWAPAAQAESVFSSDGACRLAAVTQADESTDPCEIDPTDPTTRKGDATLAVSGLLRIPSGGAVVWAWTGSSGATIAQGVERYRLDLAESDEVNYAASALLTEPPNTRKFQFGTTANYRLQLQDDAGAVRRGVDGAHPARWRLSVKAPGEDADVRTLVTNSRGQVDFPITLDDPNRSAANEVTVTYTLTSEDNAPLVVDAEGAPANTGTLIFSDGAPSIADGSATVIIDTRDYVYVSGGSASTTVTVTVLDQYGRPFADAKVKLNTGAESTVNSRGRHSFRHQYSGATGLAQTLTVGYGADSADAADATATLYWAVDAGSTSGEDAWSVVAGNVNRRQIVVTDDSVAQILIYDDKDRFNLRGRPTTLEVFEAELAEALASGAGGFELSWSNYRAKSVAEISLS